VYIGFVALVQSDMKKLIAYSSIAHMGFVTLAFFIPFYIMRNTGDAAGSTLAIQGGMVQMISHGFISAALFLCVGVLYDRLHSREISTYGGVVNAMPVFAAFFVLFAMANTGLPGTSGFVGEFMVILASIKANFWIAFLAATTLIIGAALRSEKVAGLTDLNGREFLILGLLAIMVLAIGLWPAPLINVMEVSIDHLIEHAMVSKL